MSPQDARRLQVKLSAHIIRKNRLKTVKTVAGIDVGMKGDMACAAIVVLDFPGLDIIAKTTATRRITFPYIPGLLSFREGPVILIGLVEIRICLFLMVKGSPILVVWELPAISG